MHTGQHRKGLRHEFGCVEVFAGAELVKFDELPQVHVMPALRQVLNHLLLAFSVTQ